MTFRSIQFPTNKHPKIVCISQTPLLKNLDPNDFKYIYIYTHSLYIYISIRIYIYIYVQYCETMGKLHNRPPPKTLDQSDAFAAHSRSGQRWRDLTGCNRHGGPEAWHDTPAAYFGGSFFHPFLWGCARKNGSHEHLDLFKENLANFENGFRVSSCKIC